MMAQKTAERDAPALSEWAEAWIRGRGWSPMPFQQEAWNALEDGRQGMILAPTGSGKTYSLMLPIIRAIQASGPGQGLKALWITPIRALAKEIEQAARRVIASAAPEVEVGIRTGDTEESTRRRQREKLPDILITTPESLHVLLSRRGYPDVFRGMGWIVADEWHELMGTKRGVQAELAFSRIRGISPGVRTWGISATVGNPKDGMAMLLGPSAASSGVTIQSHHAKAIEVISLMPDEAERMPWSGHLGIRMLDRVLPVLRESHSTLIFTNTRAQCEIWYRQILLAEPGLAGLIAMHHGSLGRETRHWVEDALAEGRLKAVVCTSSLDLGVDFTPVDTIIQVGGPKGVSRFLQRAGRSGHQPGLPSRIFFLPTHSLELIEAAALRQAIRDNYLESRVPMARCFDVLAQYLVTLAVGEGMEEEVIWKEVESTLAFQEVSRTEWKQLLSFLVSGGQALGAYPEYRRLVEENGVYRIATPALARRHRLSMGTIVGDTMMAVRFRRGGLIGHIEESFISSLHPGDAFWFAGQGLQLAQVKDLTAYVVRSDSRSGKIPSWQGGKLPLSSRMSDMLRRKLTEFLQGNPAGDPELERIRPVLDLQASRSRIPSEQELLMECFHSEEGYHVVVYPFEGRFVHEGLASLLAWRLSRRIAASVSIAYNDYGFELLSDTRLPMEDALHNGLLSEDRLQHDLFRAVNANELARRRFREIATIAGLVFRGYPGRAVRDRHLQNNAGLLFQVLEEYDEGNLLLRQAVDEVIMHQVEWPRLLSALHRMSGSSLRVTCPDLPTPFAFPVMVDRLREKMTSEDLGTRVRKMQLDYEG